MAISVPIKDVTSPQHLAAFVFLDRTANDRAKMEVYTGWVSVNHLSTDAPVFRLEYASFLPINNNHDVQPYGANDLLDITVTAVTSSVSDVDDEANVAAVDQATVALEPQGIGPSAANVLVLRATVAGLHSTVHAIAYQVTVVMRLPQDQDLDTIRISSNDGPG